MPLYYYAFQPSRAVLELTIQLATFLVVGQVRVLHQNFWAVGVSSLCIGLLLLASYGKRLWILLPLASGAAVGTPNSRGGIAQPLTVA